MRAVYGAVFDGIVESAEKKARERERGWNSHFSVSFIAALFLCIVQKARRSLSLSLLTNKRERKKEKRIDPTTPSLIVMVTAGVSRRGFEI